MPRRHHEDSKKPNTRPQSKSRENAFRSCDGTYPSRLAAISLAVEVGLAYFGIKGQERNGQLSDPERRLAHQCFPRSRLKKLRFRCNCDLDTPAPTFVVPVGAACARPANRVGTDACN